MKSSVSNFRRFPNVVDGLLALGGPRLREIAGQAGLSLKGVPNAPGAIAGALRDQLASPSVLRRYLSAADLDAIGKRFGLEPRSAWEQTSPSSFDEAVLARLFEERQPPAEPARRQSRRDPSGAAAWPELRDLATWTALGDSRRRQVAQALATAMGQHASALDSTGQYHLARIQDGLLGCAFVAIPGGRFEMGLDDKEKRSLLRLTQNWSEEAKMHVRALATIARPVHTVDLPPFLCAEAPVRRDQGLKGAGDAPVSWAGHEVCLLAAPAAAAIAEQASARSLTEAEWEFIARAGGARAWLAGELDPETYTATVLAGDLLTDDRHPFGIRGLGWGTWVEDGWHPSYQGAPLDGSAWEPRELPEVARSGALLSWPWQIDGEAILLHVAHRERVQSQAFPMLLARDLPAVRGG